MRYTLILVLLGLTRCWLVSGVAGTEPTAHKTAVLGDHDATRVDALLAVSRDGLQETQLVLAAAKIDGATPNGCQDSECLQRTSVGDDQVATAGLLLHYDFRHGSLPEANGRIKDLSGSGIHGVIRPTMRCLYLSSVQVGLNTASCRQTVVGAGYRVLRRFRRFNTRLPR